MNWMAYHIFEIDKLVLINTHSPLLADSLRGRENRRLVSLDNRTGEMRTNAVGIWKKTEVLSWYCWSNINQAFPPHYSISSFLKIPHAVLVRKMTMKNLHKNRMNGHFLMVSVEG